MHRVYEIFEVLPNGSPQRITGVLGLESAKAKLRELANHTPNECFAADAKTRQIVALMNVPPSKWRATKHIFQISYDEERGRRRAEFLKSRGYSVLSVIGNEAAKFVLGSSQRCDLFILGDAATAEIRREMVDWLKAQYPRVKVLAVNPPNQQLPLADYNVEEDSPESWLPIVSRELVGSGGNPESNKASTSGA